MTNTIVLRQMISDKGLKYKHIAKKLGITTYGLQKKIDNANEFKSSEIQKMCEVLGIDDLQEKEFIFFANQVD